MPDENREPDPAVGGPKPRKTWQRGLRLAAILLVLTVLTVEGIFVWPHLRKAWDSLGQIHWGWVAACIVAALASMDSFAQVQRVLFKAAGVRVSQRESLAVILASNSISATMPGGQVLSPAFIYRESRKWGAAPVIASWQLVMSGLLAGIGLAVLGLGGAILAGARTSPYSVIFSLSAFIILIALVQYLATHPEILRGVGRGLLSWVNNLRDKPADHGVERLNRILVQLGSVKLGRRATMAAFGWSFFNWVADVACLAFACYAVGAEPGIIGLMVAYAVGKAVGTAVPLLPGGIGVVDVAMFPPLVAAGMDQSDALLAILLYRLVSYLLIALIGWVVITFRYRGAIKARNDIRSEMEREESANDVVDPTDAAPTHGRDDPGRT
ncbi:MAG: YbhN family protein [Gordonia sp. (in: high G+C Gram-positive bacteria)]|uniref:lysylphosphatidylglycerol synthase transmembrane domain-containing protein n=1 Tax=Gordonia sp. (in: high G+C Gram-positive bacteria) TaxID=84139 RepID=UPI003BB608DE